MINKVKSHIKNVENFDTDSQIDLENFRIKYLGKKGIITDLFKLLKGIDEKDRVGPNFGSGHVIRGSSWRSSSLTELRLTYRERADSGLDDLGFRLARWIGE